MAAAEPPSDFKPLYELDQPIDAKIEAICKRVYGAEGVVFLPAAQQAIERYAQVGFDKLPICMAKTHLSLSHDPTLLNAPTGFTVTVRDIRAVHGGRVAGAAPRRHADHAGLRGLAGGLQRGHR